MGTETTNTENRSADAHQVVSGIALKILGITTLDSRNSDSLDFYDLSVGNIERALFAAYDAGRKSQVDGAIE